MSSPKFQKNVKPIFFFLIQMAAAIGGDEKVALGEEGNSENYLAFFTESPSHTRPSWEQKPNLTAPQSWSGCGMHVTSGEFLVIQRRRPPLGIHQPDRIDLSSSGETKETQRQRGEEPGEPLLEPGGPCNDFRASWGGGQSGRPSWRQEGRMEVGRGA